jgi:segregation and condensation protein A
MTLGLEGEAPGDGAGEAQGRPAASEGASNGASNGANQPRARSVRPDRPSIDSMADGVGVRNSYAITLDVFEGPLDLLLHLVRRHELDILDIPISFVAEKYIEYITLARSLDIEVAGEYLLMAATLAYLKSRELLPAAPVDEEETFEEDGGVDPREELIRRLIEYERFRDAGLDLSNRPLTGRDVFPRGGDLSIQLPEATLAPVTLFRLAEAYNRVLDRAKIREDHEVVLEPITVRTRMHQLSLLLTEQPRIGFEELFLAQVWSSERELRQMLVVTLMSVLEMVKLGVLGVYQAPGSDTISLERAVEVARMHHVIDDFRDEDEVVGAPLLEAGAAPMPVDAAPTPIDAPPSAPPESEIVSEVITPEPPPEPESELGIQPQPEREPMIEPPAEPEREPMIEPPAEREREPIEPPPERER